MRNLMACSVAVMATMIAYTGGISAGYAQGAQPPEIKEASGIAVIGDFEAGGQFIIVDDEEPGGYFICKKSDAAIQNTSYTSALVRKYEFTTCDFTHVNKASLATDLESVEILGKDDFLLLSESLRALIRTGDTASSGKGALVAQYYSPFSEIGGRGLEGVAVKLAPKEAGPNKYRVAVVWEGGYPERKRLPIGLKGGKLPKRAVRPVVSISNIPLLKEGDEVRDHNPHIFALKVPRIGRNQPKAQRFRATDLVWRNPQDTGDDLIVLISSHSGKNNSFKYACLVEFDQKGNALGTHLDLKKVLKDNNELVLAARANWEGLGWYNEKDLVLINDGATPATALIVKWPPPPGSPKCPGLN